MMSPVIEPNTPKSITKRTDILSVPANPIVIIKGPAPGKRTPTKAKLSSSAKPRIDRFISII